jgi:hypothetical protein
MIWSQTPARQHRFDGGSRCATLEFNGANVCAVLEALRAEEATKIA